MKPILLILLGTLLFTAFVVFSLRFQGLSRIYKAPIHAFKRSAFEIIAHRGGAHEAPENTLIAFDSATSISPEVVLELDVHLTKDGHVVACHDPSLNRTTDGTGLIKEKTLADIKKLDAAYHFVDAKGNTKYRGQNVKVPTLDEILGKYPNTRIVVEIKPNEKPAAEAVLTLIERHKAHKRVAVASSHGTVIDWIRKKKPDWLYAASRVEILRSILMGNMFLEPIDSLKADAFFIPEKSEGIRVLTNKLLNEIHRRHKAVYVWTINEEADMRRLINYGVDGLVTDQPSLLKKILMETKDQ